MSERRAQQPSAKALAASAARWTPALDRLEAIESDPVFLYSMDNPPGFWLDQSTEGQARRDALHIEYKTLIRQREAEMREKLGPQPEAE